jgi:2'-5' RNA ligase
MESVDEAPKLRLFVAIGLPEPIQDGLRNLQKKLKPFARDAKWVNPDGIHLTLKFLGYVDHSKLPEIENVLHAAEIFSPVTVRISGISYFPNPRRPNVLWVAVQAPDLLPIQKSIEENLIPLGFEQEKRGFSPHLTLARFRDPHGWLPLVRETDRLKEGMSEEFTAERFSLYRSILHRQGAEYTIMKTFYFSGKQAGGS